MEKMVFSVREMADRLGLSMPTAYNLTKREGFPIVRLGHKILIPVADLERWLSQQATSRNAG